MHARELVELAAIVAAHGPVLVRSGQRLSASSIEQYWTTSKVRLDRWAWSLKKFTADADLDARRRQAQWPHIRGVLEEILTGEALTRTWTAVLCACDRQRGNDDAEPVARSVLIGHIEARHRVLTLMVRGPDIDASAAVQLNRLRRRTERWTDLLIGYLTGLHDVSEFAVDPQRAKDFAEDLRYRGSLQGGRHAWPLMLASLQAAFRQGLGPASPNADLNARIAASILSCFPPEVFDSSGLFHSLWMLRLTNVAEDAQGMIDDLLAPERPAAGQNSAGSAAMPSGRLRRFGERQGE